MTSKKQSLLRKTGWSAAGTFSDLFCRLLAGIVIARMLGREGTGQIAFVVWMVEMVHMAATVGLPNALTQFTAELSGQQASGAALGLVRWAFKRYAVTLVAGGVVAVLWTRLWQAGTNMTGWEWPVLLLMTARCLAIFAQACYKGRQRFDVLARVTFWSGPLLLAGVGVGARLGGARAALGGYILGSAVFALLNIAALYGTSPAGEPERPLVNRFWKYAIYTWLAAVVSAFVWSRMELYFIERYRGAEEVGLYTVALALSQLAAQGPLLLVGALLPHFAELAGRGDAEAIRRLYAQATRLMALLLFPACAIGAALCPLLVPLLYGREFAAAIPTAMIVMVSAMLNFAAPGSALIYAMERSRFIFVGGLVGAILMCLGCDLLVPRWGQVGAACMRLFGQSSMIVLGTIYIYYVLKAPPPLQAIGRVFLASFAGATAPILAYVANCELTVMLILPVFGLAVYILVLRWLRAVSLEDAQVLVRVLSVAPTALRNRVFNVMRWIACDRENRLYMS